MLNLFVLLIGLQARAGELDNFVHEVKQLNCEDLLRGRRLRSRQLGPPNVWHDFAVGSVSNQLRFINHYFNWIFLAMNKDSWRHKFYQLKRSADQAGPKYGAGYNALYERAVALVDDCQTLGEFNDLVDGISARRDQLVCLIDADQRERRRAELRPDYCEGNYRRKVWETAKTFFKLDAGLESDLVPRLDNNPAFERFLLHEIQFLRRLGLINQSPTIEKIVSLRIANDHDALTAGKIDFAQLANLRRALLILKSPRLFSGLTDGSTFEPWSTSERESLIRVISGNAELGRALLAAGVDLERIEILRLSEDEEGHLNKPTPSRPQNYEARLYANIGAKKPEVVTMYHDEFLEAYTMRQRARRVVIASLKNLYPELFRPLEPSDRENTAELSPPPPPPPRKPVRYVESHDSSGGRQGKSWDEDRSRGWDSWDFDGPNHVSPPPFD